MLDSCAARPVCRSLVSINKVRGRRNSTEDNDRCLLHHRGCLLVSRANLASLPCHQRARLNSKARGGKKLTGQAGAEHGKSIPGRLNPNIRLILHPLHQ